MPAEKKIEKSEPMATGLKTIPPTRSAEQDVGLGKDGLSSDFTPAVSLGNSSSRNKGETAQVTVGEQGVYYPPASCYNYYYPGYDGSYLHMDGYMHDGFMMPQIPPDFSPGIMKGFYPAGKFSSFANNRQGGLFQHHAQRNYRLNSRMWNGNDRYKFREKLNRNGEFESSPEITRGPRTYNKSASSDSSEEKDSFGLTARKDQYNLPDFQIDYENAKFYVIKSYSEDDIHKCLKYDVWTSTPNGNKKLDAAFQDAERKSSDTGKTCPVFLFFSVNGSGQFVGCAEMIGQVDFKKNMDFWQLDKWNGFFPVKWHIVKDIPNVQLRHIILENNENRPVTYSRDTQEVGLKQGLEMLKIFKDYSSKTSLLDDLTFYEKREKSVQVKRSSKTAPSHVARNINGGVRKSEQESAGSMLPSETAASLVNLTENLSIGVSPLKNSCV